MVGRRTILTLGLAILFLMALGANGFCEEKYRVKPGDSLARIAKKYHVTPQALRDANGLGSDALEARQVLVIPGHGQKHKGKKVAKTATRIPPDHEVYVAKKGDTIYSVAAYAGISAGELKKLNHLRTKKLKKGQRLIIPTQEAVDATEELGDADDITNLSSNEPDEDKAVSTPLGKWKNPDERKLFVKVTKTFLGVPYRLGGSSMKGIDCSALVKRVYEIFDIELPRTAREQSRIGKWVSKNELEEGDLVFFKTRSRRVTGHVGIYIGNDEFVHASGKNRGTKVDSLASEHYSKRFVRGVRVKELDKEFAKTL